MLTERQKRLIQETAPRKTSGEVKRNILSDRQQRLILDNAPKTAPNPIRRAETMAQSVYSAPSYETERADEFDKMVTLSPTRADAYRKQLDDMAKERATLLRQLERTGVSDNARISEIDEKSAALEKLLNDPSSLERVARTVGGGAKQYGSSHLNTIGMVSDALGGTAMSSVYESNIGMLDEEIAALERQAADTTLTEAERQEARDALGIAYGQRGIYEGAIRSGEATGKEVYKIADAVAQSGAEDVERAKQGLGVLGQLGVDLGVQGTQMVLDRALGGDALSLLALGTRSFGGSAQEARQEGATREQAAFYGLGNAAVEVVAERIFDGLAGLYGKGGADEIVERLISRISKNPNVRDALGIAFSAGGESVEELISGIANPILKSIYNDKSIGENLSSIEIGDLMYDMLVGGIMGGFGGTVETTAGNVQAAGILADKDNLSEFSTLANRYSVPFDIADGMSDAEKRSAVKDTMKAIGEEVEKTRKPIMYYGKEAANEKVKETPTPTDAVKRGSIIEDRARVMGEEGALMLRTKYDGKQDEEAYAATMFESYAAGRDGNGIESVRGAGATQEQIAAAYLAGMNDKAKAVAMRVDAAYNDRNNIKEASDGEEAGNARSGRDGERQDNLAAGEQSGSVETRTGALEEGQSGSAQAQRAAEIRTRTETARVVSTSTASQGISIGTSKKTLKVIPSSLWEDDMRSLSREQQKKGRQVIYFVGEMEMKSKDGSTYSARGAISKDGKRIWVRADHPTLTVEQIIKHEEYHAAARKDKTLNERLKAQLSDRYVEEWVGDLSYVYTNLYFTDENGEVTETAENILEEILADAYAGIDVLEGEDVSAARATEATDAVKEAVQEADNKKTATDGGAEKASIETLPDGKKYVRADRQVIFGNDPDSWSEQLEDYINSKIRRGQNVLLIAADGDILTLTSRTAGKIADRHKDGETLDDEYFARKVSAGSHIDELATVSKRGKKTVGDEDNRHGDEADGGWNYRTAFFRDFDGKYYRCRISVEIGVDGNAVYNIGDMKERSFPNIDGSSAKRGALNGKTSSADSIRNPDETVNTKTSRETTQEKIAKIKEHYREKEARARERRDAKAIREKIQRHVKKLSDTLLKGTDKKHIPEELQAPVAKLLEAINLESTYELEYGTDAMYHRVPRGSSPFSESTKRTKAFEELRKAYQEIAADTDTIDDVFDTAIELGDKLLYEMTTEELDTVWDAVKVMEGMVRNANKAFRVSKAKGIAETAAEIHADNVGKTETKTLKKPWLSRVQKLIRTDMLTPEAYFHRLGKTGDNVFRALRDSQDEYIRIMAETKDFRESKLGNIDAWKLEKDMHAVTLGGESVELSTAQLMELYALMRREQARGHIFGGGIEIEDKANVIRGITLDEVSDALSVLSEEQIAAAEAMQDYLSNELSEYGNKASMEVFNYRKFKEKFYWPIRSASAETKKTIQDENVKSTPDKGWTKATKKNAKNALRLESAFDTFGAHASEMAHYAAYRAVLEDVNRLRNYKARTGNVIAWTMQETLNRVFGKKEGDAYLSQLLQDITTGASGKSSDTGLTGGLTGTLKAASVGANIRVMIQQPTSILRALDEIDAKYFSNIPHPLRGWKKAKKYAPIAQWKDWGYFEIGTGKQMKDLVFGSESKFEKAKEFSMKGAAFFDAFSWGFLWNVCEAEIKDTRSDLAVDTEDFYNAVAARFTDVVDKTQVVDGVLQRSQAMRNKDGIVKMATSFMSEPTKQYNMLLSSVYDARNGDAKAKKKLARTAVSLCVSMVLNAAAQSFVDALRDDDREKGYWDKWLKHFSGVDGDDTTVKSVLGSNIGDAFNPGQYIPFIKDSISLLRGFDVSRMDMDGIGDVIKSAEAVFKVISGSSSSKYNTRGAVIKLINDTAKLFGIPVANVKRDVYAAVRTIAQETDNYLLEYEIATWEKSYSGNKSHYISILYDAFKNDTEAYEIIYRDLVKNNAFKTASTSTSEAIASAMEKKMKEEQGVKNVAELDERYLTPDQKEVYDKSIKRVQKYSVWSKANKTQRKTAENIVYDLTLGVGESKDYEKIISGGKEYGLTEDEFIAYKLALAVVDEPNKSGKLGTFTEDEKREALKMLKELSLTQKEKDYLKNPSKYNK